MGVDLSFTDILLCRMSMEGKRCETNPQFNLGRVYCKGIIKTMQTATSYYYPLFPNVKILQMLWSFCLIKYHSISKGNIAEVVFGDIIAGGTTGFASKDIPLVLNSSLWWNTPM